jgi:hypothetical protein
MRISVLGAGDHASTCPLCARVRADKPRMWERLVFVPLFSLPLSPSLSLSLLTLLASKG